MSDVINVGMPSGRRFVAEIETPLSLEDKAWLHKLIDLLLDEGMLGMLQQPRLDVKETPDNGGAA